VAEVVTGTEQRKAVVLLSGGMDSCVSTAIVREGHGASNIALLHASYGQLTQERERRAFDDIANFYGVRERLVVQLDHFRAISVAVSWAEAIGAGAIYIGAVAEDSSGYPDCRPEYYRVFQELIRVGTRPETQIEIATPVITLKKSAIIRRGIELGAPLHLTWSCYQNEDTACGACDSCLLRLRAFAEAGVPDPIPYRRTVSAGR
jgi:7-cyano-7-deazaguanine synthase